MKIEIEIPDNHELVKEGDIYRLQMITPKKRQWLNYGIIKKGFYIDDQCNIHDYSSVITHHNNRNTAPTKKLCEAWLAMCQIQQWLLKPEFNGDWKWEPGTCYYTIKYDCGKPSIYDCWYYECSVKIKSKEIAEAFLEEFSELLILARPLL